MTDTELSLLNLLADIRAAVGDPTGKLMQSDLVEHCREMHAALITIYIWADVDAASTETRQKAMHDIASQAEKALSLK